MPRILMLQLIAKDITMNRSKDVYSKVRRNVESGGLDCLK